LPSKCKALSSKPVGKRRKRRRKRRSSSCSNGQQTFEKILHIISEENASQNYNEVSFHPS
jgi:transcriptional regulator NrdR family protein